MGKVLGTLSPFLENFDEENSIPVLSGIHHKKLLSKVYGVLRFSPNLPITAVIFRFQNPGMFCTVKTTPNLFNGSKKFEIIFFTFLKFKGALSRYTQANEYHFDGGNSIETTNH